MFKNNKYLTAIKHSDNNKVMKQALSYLRYSDPGQGQGYTLENQRDYCLKVAEQKEYKIIKEFKDEGISGGDKAFSKRKGLLNLLAFCRGNKKKNVSALIVYKIDRLSRSSFIYANVKKELAEQGIRIISATEETPNNPTGEVMQGIFSLFAEWDNATRSLRATDGMRKRIENGLHPTKPPCGYLPNGKKKPKKDPERFELLKEGWLLFEKGGYTVESMASYLQNKGLTAISYNNGRVSPITAKNLYKIFRNPYYCGYIQSSLIDDKEYPGIHDEMIDTKTYQKVQSILNGNNSLRKPKQKLREEFPMRGLVFCKCGNALTGCFCQGKKKKYPYYLCPKRDTKPIPTRVVHDEFVKLLEKISPNKKFVSFYTALLKEKWEKRYSTIKSQKKASKMRLKEIDKKLAILLELRLDNEINKKDYFLKKKNLKDEKLLCKSDLEESKLDKLDIEASISFLKSFLTAIPKYWLEANVIQKRALQCLIFKEKLTFEGKSYQTPVVTDEFRLLLPQKSTDVTPRGIEPRFLG